MAEEKATAALSYRSSAVSELTEAIEERLEEASALRSEAMAAEHRRKELEKAAARAHIEAIAAEHRRSTASTEYVAAHKALCDRVQQLRDDLDAP